MGTSVTSGKGTCVIVATGMRTELGKIAGLIQEAGKEETPFNISSRYSGKLVYLCLGIVTIVFSFRVVEKRPPFRGVPHLGKPSLLTIQKAYRPSCPPWL